MLLFFWATWNQVGNIVKLHLCMLQLASSKYKDILLHDHSVILTPRCQVQEGPFPCPTVVWEPDLIMSELAMLHAHLPISLDFPPFPAHLSARNIPIFEKSHLKPHINVRSPRIWGWHHLQLSRAVSHSAKINLA